MAILTFKWQFSIILKREANMEYSGMNKDKLEKILSSLNEELEDISKDIKVIDMTRGRPSQPQLDIAMPMFENVKMINYNQDGMDVRNYGGLLGISKAREYFTEVLDVKPEEVMVQDGSSLELMYNLIQSAMQFGIMGEKPWNKLEKVKFICPAPGYDRHFGICEHFGIEMITVPILADGPDVSIIEDVIKSNPDVKGMWCVPKYSNPTGITYSSQVVDKIANLKLPKDFRIFWDNAYVLQDLCDDGDELKSLIKATRNGENRDKVYEFTSTSKITFAGSGIAALATSVANIEDYSKHLSIQKICPNKVNQLFHIYFLKNKSNTQKIIKQHARYLIPKFKLVIDKLTKAFGEDTTVSFSNPKGGYFISYNVPNCAKRIVELCNKHNVKFTKAGATYPYGNDDRDANIRIAPSIPTIEELEKAISVLIVATQIAQIENAIKNLKK